MRRKIMPLTLLALVFEIESSGAQEKVSREAAERLRATLLVTSVGRNLTIAFRNGETLEGSLAEVGDESFRVWTTPDEDTRDRLRITGARVKRTIRYDEVESILGAGDALGEASQSIPASSTEGLAYRMRLGDTITVRTANGETIEGKLRNIEGEILRLDDMTLSLSGAEGQKIEQIDLKVEDSPKNGILIGAAVGASLATLGALGCYGCTTGDVIVGVSFYTAAGVGLGALIDSLSHRRELIYVAPVSPPEPRFRVGPIFSRDRKGLLVSWSF